MTQERPRHCYTRQSTDIKYIVKKKSPLLGIGVFEVKKLKRGIYQIKAEWAQDVNGEHINIEGSLKAGITVSQSIKITVSKSESEG